MNKHLHTVILVSFTFLTALLLPACEKDVEEWQVGEEVRLTDDAEPNLDPFWFHYEGDLDTLSGCKICFHDGSNIKVYDFDTESIQTIRTAPAGYEITALQDIRGDVSPEDYIYALSGNGEVIINAVFNGEEEEVYRDDGDPVEGVLAFYDLYGALYLIIEVDNMMYYLNEEDRVCLGEGSHISYLTDITDGQDMFYELGFNLYYTCDLGSESAIMYGLYHRPNDYWYKNVVLSDHNFNDYPSSQNPSPVMHKPHYYVSDRNGNNDIWIMDENVQVTDTSEAESYLETYDEYVVYTKEVDGQLDLFRVRCIGPEYQY